MDLKVKTERLDAGIPGDISRAAEILRAGGTVAFPTETVYGLGANALSPEAVAKIFEAKQRPSWDPLIVHISDREMLTQVCSSFSPAGLSFRSSPFLSFRSEAKESAFPAATAAQLMDRFWPGPLTLLLPRTPAIPDAVTAGRPLVGVRMPNHPIALELIRQAGLPIAAPSANTFGHTSPTTAAHVLADLDGRIDAVLDGGPTEVGLESTVAGFVDDQETGYPFLLVYRAGAVSFQMLESEIGCGAVELYIPATAPTPESLPSPGVGLRHYAPHARLILVGDLREEEIVRAKRPLELSLVPAIDRAFDGTETIGVMLPDQWNSSCAQLVYKWGPWHEPTILAQRLFAGLRDLDDRGATLIVCPVPAASFGISEAIRDRLSKAAKPKQ